MPQLSVPSVLLAVLLAFGGILVLRRTWAKKGVRVRGEVTAGWALITVSLVLWLSISPADWGTAMALCVLMTLGMAMMAYAAYRQPAASMARKAGAGRAPRAARTAGMAGTVASTVAGDAVVAAKAPRNWKLGGRRVFTFLLAGPIAGASALYLSLWLYGAMPDGVGRVAAIVYIFPTLWAVLSVFATYDMAPVKRGGIVIISGLVGAIGTQFVA